MQIRYRISNMLIWSFLIKDISCIVCIKWIKLTRNGILSAAMSIYPPAHIFSSPNNSMKFDIKIIWNKMFLTCLVYALIILLHNLLHWSTLLCITHPRVCIELGVSMVLVSPQFILFDYVLFLL